MLRSQLPRTHQSASAIYIAGLIALSVCGCAPEQDTVGVVDRVTGLAPNRDGCAAGVPLKQRPEGEPISVLDAMLESSNATQWQLVRQGQYVTVQGQGYLNLRWQIEYTAKAGLITPPSFTVASGTFRHVGGGGGKNLGDPEPGTSGSWMGNEEDGLSYMPDGVPTPWQNEFYYLDGEVSIALNETDGLYNITVSAQTYQDVISADWGIYNPGVVCDFE